MSRTRNSLRKQNKNRSVADAYTLKRNHYLTGGTVSFLKQTFHFMNCPDPCEYLSHSFFYNFGGQVISPALHAELVPALKSCKILQEKIFQSGKLENT